eukprot:CAMPEP_0171732524 /NCGR_PEP_ID=MMETSP0991-20121206/29645_1 /TAXON_ID=483369 /ORGANISM="non described non described, Strain CCMP2098" /LENGTH=144 /DNA_ID=CAMNT_0012327879 /DNA_START=204 /DNA_END=635 /DNA_ORIENTATION=-
MGANVSSIHRDVTSCSSSDAEASTTNITTDVFPEAMKGGHSWGSQATSSLCVTTCTNVVSARSFAAPDDDKDCFKLSRIPKRLSPPPRDSADGIAKDGDGDECEGGSGSNDDDVFAAVEEEGGSVTNIVPFAPSVAAAAAAAAA